MAWLHHVAMAVMVTVVDPACGSLLVRPLDCVAAGGAAPRLQAFIDLAKRDLGIKSSS